MANKFHLGNNCNSYNIIKGFKIHTLLAPTELIQRRLKNGMFPALINANGFGLHFIWFDVLNLGWR